MSPHPTNTGKRKVRSRNINFLFHYQIKNTPSNGPSLQSISVKHYRHFWS